MKEYKSITNGQYELGKAVIAELTELGYTFQNNGLTRFSEAKGIVTSVLTRRIYFHTEDAYDGDNGEEVTIYDLIELVRLKSEKEAITELTIEEIRTKLGLKGELKIVK